MILVDNIKREVKTKIIIEDISLELKQGMTVIIGDSGSGKSTLLNLIGGLDRVNQGEISLLLDGKKINIKDVEQYTGKYIGFIFQDYNLIPGLTVMENLLLMKDLSEDQITEEDIYTALEKLNVLQLADEKVDVLSGGEKQRIALVRALIKKSQIILADEPTGSLDSHHTEMVFKLLKEISSERIVVVVTHNKEMAQVYADEIVELCDGKIKSHQSLRHDERKKTEIRKINQIGKLSISNIKRLSLNNLTKYRGKFIAMMITVGLAIGLLGISAFMSNAVSVSVDKLDNTYYDMDLVTVYEQDKLSEEIATNLSETSDKEISEEFLQELEDSEMFEEIVPVSDTEFFVENGEKEVSVKQIIIDSYFENRIMTGNLEGDYIQEDDQIIIGEDLADEYYAGNGIGEQITLCDQDFEEYTYTIVGVNHISNVDGVYLTYISNNSVLQKQKESSNVYIYSQESLESDDNVCTETTSGKLMKGEASNIVYGSQPTEENEIVISVDQAREIYSSMTGEYESFTLDQLLQKDEEAMQMADKVLRQDYIMESGGMNNCKIVGIHDEDDIRIYGSEKMQATVLKNSVVAAQCYATDVSSLKNLANSEIGQNYYYESNYENRFVEVSRSTQIWKMLFTIICGISIVLAYSLIHAYLKISIHDRIYEIGILKSLGVGKKEIKKVLRFDCVMIGVSSGIVAMIVNIVASILLYEKYDLSMTSVQLNILLCVGLLIFAIIVSVISSLYQVYRAAELKPIDALKM
ncbi:ATP-binding cassette domain-containing protein [Eubacterium oxidoreducens]|uniref:ABC-type lipoprotein export system, ATPase component n=1 Tax=Eubacterium oxidoreducens TaxID=1732 RepID=A0A1G6C848_EUBOX|nr:ATP-binding cassette domain-containing protein [Eubacterium oxidoreducens]SDB29056.1 ABC-type lipoprotein export system, ATPase component [Eubacterium oxidoreducens]